MYSVEAEYIDKVVAQYGPCRFSAYSGLFHELTSTLLSYQDGSHRGRADIRESA